MKIIKVCPFCFAKGWNYDCWRHLNSFCYQSSCSKSSRGIGWPFFPLLLSSTTFYLAALNFPVVLESISHLAFRTSDSGSVHELQNVVADLGRFWPKSLHHLGQLSCPDVEAGNGRSYCNNNKNHDFAPKLSGVSGLNKIFGSFVAEELNF